MFRTVVRRAVLPLATAVPAAAQITRVSVSTAGVEANAPSGRPSISGNGRFVVFASPRRTWSPVIPTTSPTSSCAIGTPTPTASSTSPAR